MYNNTVLPKDLPSLRNDRDLENDSIFKLEVLDNAMFFSAAQVLHQLETEHTICMPTHTLTGIFSTYQQLIMNVLRKLLNHIILIYLFYSWSKWNQNEEIFLEHQKEPFER